MKIVVCIKQVPVVSAMQFDAQTRTLKREGVPTEVSAFDVRAVLKAVELKQAHDGEVVVVTMGPPGARVALEDCLALGADRGLHLCDRAFAGADTLATARALALALRPLAADLILCGRNSTDAETGQVGPELAELLDLPQITGARTLTVDLAARRVTAERETDAGFETVESPLPVVITAAEDLSVERFATKAERAAAKEKPIAELNAAALGGDPGAFGQAGSPTWVAGLTILEEKREGRIIEAPSPEGAVDELVELLSARGLLDSHPATDGGGALRRSGRDARTTACAESTAESITRDGSSDVLVVGELLGGALRDVTLELVNKAAALAAQVGGAVSVLLSGDGARRHVDVLARHGAQRVLLAEDSAWQTAGTEPHATLLAAVIERERPGIVLLPSTVYGRDLAPRVAARLGLGLTGDCIDVSFDGEGRLLQHKPAFGGSVVAPILSRTRPEMATVRPGMLALGEGDRTGRADVVGLPAVTTPGRVRVLEQRAAAETAAELDRADIVVGVGMGIGGPENLPVVTALADVLGGAICTTRDVTDKGWLPKQYQVGLTGRAIAPRLYIAVGIRGAFEHVVGVRRAGLIVAINTKPKAPIFKVADLGVVGDYAVIVPLLTARVRERIARSEA